MKLTFIKTNKNNRQHLKRQTAALCCRPGSA